MNGWYKLYTTRNAAEANIIKGMLEKNQVPVVIFNRQDSSYLAFGEIDLYVQPHFIEIAKQLLDKALLN